MKDDKYNGTGDHRSDVTVSAAFRSLPKQKRVAVIVIAAALLLITAMVSVRIGRTAVPTRQTGELILQTDPAITETEQTDADATNAKALTDSPTEAPYTTEPATEPPVTVTTEPTTAEPTTEETTAEETTTLPADAQDYVVNTNTGKFHKPSCSSVEDMKPANRSYRTCVRDDLLAEGYVPCKRCNP